MPVFAWTRWDRLLSDAERSGGLRVLADGVGRVNNHQFYLAHRDFLQRSPDMLDSLMRALLQTGSYIDHHRREAACLLADELGLTPEAMQVALARRSHQAQVMNLSIVREQQKIADRFYALGVLPRPVQVRDAVWQPA